MSIGFGEEGEGEGGSDGDYPEGDDDEGPSSGLSEEPERAPGDVNRTGKQKPRGRDAAPGFERDSYGGGGGIRTLVGRSRPKRFSRPPHSTALPPLRMSAPRPQPTAAPADACSQRARRLGAGGETGSSRPSRTGARFAAATSAAGTSSRRRSCRRARTSPKRPGAPRTRTRRFCRLRCRSGRHPRSRRPCVPDRRSR